MQHFYAHLPSEAFEAEWGWSRIALAEVKSKLAVLYYEYMAQLNAPVYHQVYFLQTRQCLVAAIKIRDTLVQRIALLPDAGPSPILSHLTASNHAEYGIPPPETHVQVLITPAIQEMSAEIAAGIQLRMQLAFEQRQVLAFTAVQPAPQKNFQC